MDELYEFDVFLSYAKADSAAVLLVAEGLKKAGIRVWLDQWQRPSIHGIENDVAVAFHRSRALVLFVSANTLSGQWKAYEEQMYRFRDPGNKGRRFVPLRLDDAPLPVSLQQVEYIEWNAVGVEQTLERLIAVCRPPEVKPSARALGVARIIFNKKYTFGSAAETTTLCLDIEANQGAVGTSSGKVHTFSVSAPATPKLTIDRHHGIISSLQFHSSGKLLLSVSADRQVRVWNSTTGELVHRFTDSPHLVSFACFVDDSVAIALADGAIELWDDPMKGAVPRHFRGHVGPVYTLAATANLLVSGGADRTVRVWSVRTGRCLFVLEGHVEPVRSLALDKSGTKLLSSSDDRTIRLWNLSNGLCLNSFDAHTDSVRAIAWHPSEHTFVSGGGDWALRLWNVDGRLLRVLDGNKHSTVMVHFGSDIVRSSDGETLYEWHIDPALTNAPPTLELTQSSGDQIQYTNAKVLLVGDSAAGKTGLAKRLASGIWEPAQGSTVGAWATQWSLPNVGTATGEREIWLWDFGGQADQRLIHQLYMDETAWRCWCLMETGPMPLKQ